MTTFCWLPPESEPMAAAGPEVLTVTARIDSSTTLRSAGRDRSRPLTKAAMEASDRFCPTDIVCTRPSRCRSSGTRARPSEMRSAIER